MSDPSVPANTRSMIEKACQVRACTERELAAWLGLSPRALRLWRERQAPRYIRLALAAVIRDPDSVKRCAVSKSRIRPDQL